ncbi:MAG: hypothetical protein QXH91_01665, partial [Candidatus Bathyarchaeia archaeon]
MERNLRILLAFFALLLGLSPFTIVAPWIGLSTILGIFVLSSSVLGSSVLGSSVLASTTIVEAYAGAVVASQLWLSLVAIGLLVYLELSDPTYGVFRKSLVELRRSWLPV